jgi:hypothetical protein
MSFGEYFSAFGSLGDAYKQGADEAQRKQALAALGTQLQAGDYAGAAQTAFQAGDPGTGIGLLKLGEASRLEGRKDAFSRDFSAGFGALYGGGDMGVPRPVSQAGPSVPSFLDGSSPSSGYVAGLFKRESNNNDFAQAPTSSARGAAQFTVPTWNRLASQMPGLNLTPVGGGQDGRTDRDQMLRATNALTAQNEGVLQQSGLPVSDASRYALHFLGAGGGRRLVAGAMRNPDAPAASYANPDQVAANRNVFFNRDGSPKSAGQVMADFGRSFGGGSGGGGAVRQAQAPSSPSVAYADDEAQTQALEQRMGMLPPSSQRQVASADPQADMPMPGAQEAAFVIPGGDTAAIVPPGLSGDGRMVPGGIPPKGAQSFPTRDAAPTGRVMAMPGSTPSPQIPPDATIGGQPAAAISASPLGQRIPALMRAMASPYIEGGQKELASMLLKQALDETKMPDSVKEFAWARAHGMTQAKSPAAYALEKAPDQRQIVTAPDGRQYIVNKSDENAEPRSLNLPSPGVRVWGTVGADGQPIQAPPGTQAGTPGYYDEKGAPHVSLTPGTNQSDKSNAQLDKNVTDYLQTSFDKSQGAVGTLAAIDRQKRALDAGLISGSGADWQTKARAVAVKLLGLPEDAVTNSQVFDAASTQKSAELAKTISQAGHTTNMDLQLGATIAGGDRTKTESAIRAIVAAQEQLARDQITRHNSAVDKYQKIRPDAAPTAEFYRMGTPSVYEYGDAAKERGQQAPQQAPPPSFDRSALEAEARRRGLL